MAQDSGAMEQAVSRAIRDNLAALQRTAEELDRALADLVAACSSSRPGNALPPMLRAQTVAASLAASLEVLAKFVTAALQAPQRTPAEEALLRVIAIEAPQPSPAPEIPPPRIPVPMAEGAPVVDVESAEPGMEELTQEARSAVRELPPEVEVPADEDATEILAEDSLVTPIQAEPEPLPPLPEAIPEMRAEEPAMPVEVAPPPRAPAVPAFDLSSLPAQERELHRRASRVAKVSMQDIKLLRPEQVRLGRQNKDICQRLQNDIDKARKEYDRRFGSILNHPVDYFYQWMVDILAEGDAEALGEYPYPSPVLRR